MLLILCYFPKANFWCFLNRAKRLFLGSFFALFLLKNIVPKLKLFAPAVIWFFVIFYLLVMPGDKIPRGGIFSIPNFDKFVHASLFGMQVLLASFPFFRSKYASAGLFFKIAIGAIVYGIAMEFVQEYFTPDRDFDILDMVADSVGALTGFACMNFLYKRMQRKQQAVI